MKIIPVLRLAKKTFIILDEYATWIIDKLTGNLNFPVTDPTVADVQLKADAYHKSVVAAVDGTKSQTQAKKLLRKELCVMLTDLAYDVAAKSNGDTVKFLTSGFDYKKQGTPAGIPAAPVNFLLVFNDFEGQLVAKYKGVEKARVYEIWLGTTPYPDSTVPASGGSTGTDPVPAGNDWKMAGTQTGTKYVLKGLTSGIKYYARVRAVGTGGLSGAWSDVASKTCP